MLWRSAVPRGPQLFGPAYHSMGLEYCNDQQNQRAHIEIENIAQHRYVTQDQTGHTPPTSSSDM